MLLYIFSVENVHFPSIANLCDFVVNIKTNFPYFIQEVVWNDISVIISVMYFNLNTVCVLC